jgi:ABC-type sugar transport system substrate-binding protein
MKEILDTRPGVKVVCNESAHWSRDEAKKLVDGWLNQGVHIDAIAADSDEMALGAVTALRAHGIAAGKVFVGGIDGTSNGLNGIRSGDLTVTLRQDTAAMAHMALVNAKALATGGYAQQYEWVPYQIVLPSTVSRYAMTGN